MASVRVTVTVARVARRFLDLGRVVDLLYADVFNVVVVTIDVKVYTRVVLLFAVLGFDYGCSRVYN